MQIGKIRISRAFLSIITALVVLILYAYFFGLQTFMYVKYRSYKKQIPVLALTPQELPTVPASPSVNGQLSYAGYQFAAPWAGLDKQKSKYANNLAAYAFSSGRSILFYGPSPTHEDLLSEAEKSMGDTHASLRKLFGAKATPTNYAFQDAMLSETPRDLKPWMDQREAIRISMILLIKGVSSVGGETGLFRVRSNGWQGFQFDDPAKHPRQIALELYDPQDRHIEIIFSNAKSGTGITQGEVNTVLQTLAEDRQGPGTPGDAKVASNAGASQKP